MTRVPAKPTSQGIFPFGCPLNRICSDGKMFCEHLDSYIIYPGDYNGATLNVALVDCKFDDSQEGKAKP